MKQRICKFCGESFLPRSNRQIYCDRNHYRQCVSCGKLYLEKYHENLSKPPRLCSPNCAAKIRINETPEFRILAKLNTTVIVDSTICRRKYDNLNISKKMNSKGLSCIHVFPEEDIDKIIAQNDIVETCDSSEFQVYKLNSDYAEEFLEQNSIQKHMKSLLYLGLIKNYQIYQVISFTAPRYNHNYEYEISNICTKLHTKIAGGLDLLSSVASINFGVTSCIAYQDLSKMFSSKMFRDIGMRSHHSNPPHLLKSSVYDCGTRVLIFD